jgi:sterol desaturase/sphingolipid hydroxylase (fatty acid hydroxylase superfamily)
MILGLISSHIAIALPLGIFSYTPILLKYVVIIIFGEIWFHHSHLLLHHPLLYKHIHAKHHEFVEPYALVSVFCTIPEFFICNFPTVVIAPILVNLTGYYLYFWVFLASLDVTLAHSRLFNCKLYNNLHDLHHKHMNCNYGVIDIFDKLYGTYRIH